MPEDHALTALSRRRFLLGGAVTMLGGGGAALAARRRVIVPSKVGLARGVPSVVGPWRMISEQGETVNPLERGPRQQYDQEVSRVYQTVDRSLPFIMLVIAYGSTQSDNLQVHRPEFCYPAAGFALGRQEPVMAPIGGRQLPLVFFTAQREQRVEHVLYWTRLGEDFPTSWLGQHEVRMRQSIRGIVPDGILVRASVIGGTAEVAKSLLANFLAGVTASSPADVRVALLGSSNSA